MSNQPAAGKEPTANENVSQQADADQANKRSNVGDEKVQKEITNDTAAAGSEPKQFGDTELNKGLEAQARNEEL